MFKINKIFIFGILLSFSTADSTELSSGYYHSPINKDSIVVDSNNDRVELELSTGSKLRFESVDGKYIMQNLSGDGYTALRVLADGKFQVYYDHQDLSLIHISEPTRRRGLG